MRPRERTVVLGRSLGTWLEEGLGGEVVPKALEGALLEGTRVGPRLQWL